ncbi:hypothetical protein BGX29_007181 [Mortierella sp. GBA35]|nr:hypothetical protein BGX29_007181 [Mortierella sp. GBA35]
MLGLIRELAASRLVHLTLDIGDISEQDARTFFPALKVVQELELVHCTRKSVVDAVADARLERLVKLCCLVGDPHTSPVIDGDIFNDSTIKKLAQSYPTMQDLCIFNNNWMTSAGLVGFADYCKTLTRLQLECCRFLNAEGISALIKESPMLEYVSLGHVWANDTNLTDLTTPPERALHLRGLSITYSGLVTTIGIRAIVNSCANLEELDFELCPQVTMDVFSEPTWSCSGLKVLNMSNMHGGSDRIPPEIRQSRVGAAPGTVVGTHLEDMYRQIGRLARLQELDMCGLTFDPYIMRFGRDAIEGLGRLRILRISELFCPVQRLDVMWLATRVPSLRWLELDGNWISDDFRMELMSINREIRIFFVGKRDHAKRALQRRLRYAQPPIPDLPAFEDTYAAVESPDNGFDAEAYVGSIASGYSTGILNFGGGQLAFNSDDDASSIASFTDTDDGHPNHNSYNDDDSDVSDIDLTGVANEPEDYILELPYSPGVDSEDDGDDHHHHSDEDNDDDNTSHISMPYSPEPSPSISSSDLGLDSEDLEGFRLPFESDLESTGPLHSSDDDNDSHFSMPYSPETSPSISPSDLGLDPEDLEEAGFRLPFESDLESTGPSPPPLSSDEYDNHDSYDDDDYAEDWGVSRVGPLDLPSDDGDEYEDEEDYPSLRGIEDSNGGSSPDHDGEQEEEDNEDGGVNQGDSSSEPYQLYGSDSELDQGNSSLELEQLYGSDDDRDQGDGNDSVDQSDDANDYSVEEDVDDDASVDLDDTYSD